ncbi:MULTISPECIES: phage tail tape measure protein [unclassified Variovorax]|uniref:phage tail tape measure protein n=1 Tax=unclassified Variovorax TaxID=663243 RepID=UPI003F469466
MTQDLRIALTTSLNDKLVAPLRRALGEVEGNLKQIEKELQKTNTASTQANATMANMKGPQQAAKQAAELSRETQRAIGLAERLRSAWTTTGNMIKGVAAGVAAVQAAKMVVAPALQQARSYDRQLADASNTAFSDRDLAGRKMGMRELDATVQASMRAGGGKREDILGGLNDMLASGSVTPDQAKNLLPTVSKYAAAGNASVGDLSTIVVRALQNGFKEADIPKMLDMALAAGQAGGFELKDMAKWLPKFLASAQMSGLNGMDGYARILASAQGSVITAGSKDEAGNNLQNLLLKINSSDTAQDAKKLGIDLSGSLAAAREKGVNSLDAFVNLVDKIAGKDPRLVALRKKTAAAGNDEERQASLSAQADILQGSAIGKIIQDRQALMPLIAELNKKDYIQGVKKTVMGANGQYGDSNFELISQTPDFKVQQKENEELIAQTTVLGSANTALGKLAEGTTDLYRKYPGYGAAVEGVTLTVKALAVAAGVASGALMLLGGGSLKNMLGGSAAGGAGGAAAAAARSGIMNASPSWTAPAASAGAVGLGTAGAVIGGTAAGLVAVGAPILGAGMLLSERANSQAGLTDRIASRNARISELGQLADASRDNGASPAYLAKLEQEKSQLEQDRNALSQKLDQLIAGMKEVGARPIQVNLDGREIQSSTNQHNSADARRN